MAEPVVAEIEIGGDITCPWCDGDGTITCPECDGTGTYHDETKVELLRADTPCWNCGERPGVTVLKDRWLCALCTAYSAAMACGR